MIFLQYNDDIKSWWDNHQELYRLILEHGMSESEIKL